jgi:SAM-dependent methyltransferase
VSASHLDFYGRHKISPVRQDISDWQRHAERRGSLFWQLGIRPGDIRGRRVLEVGPGGGFNALYTASLEPGHYVLVEGNPTGAAELRENFAANPALNGNVEIIETLVEEFDADQPFDFVFCEGVLSGVPNPEQVLDRLARATAAGGLLITTCVDHISHFPETIRRLFAQILIEPEMPLEQSVEIILPAMRPHLETLSGMSRRHDDWVIDNLIHPGSIIPLINFPETVAVLAHTFEFFSSSPRFVNDWRWYKSIAGEDGGFNALAIKAYWRNVHSFLDHRCVFAERDEIANQTLYDRCTRAREFVQRFEMTRNMSCVDGFRDTLADIVADAETYSHDLANALGEALDLLERGPLQAGWIADAGAFGRLFGRGQQYLSLSKTA